MKKLLSSLLFAMLVASATLVFTVQSSADTNAFAEKYYAIESVQVKEVVPNGLKRFSVQSCDTSFDNFNLPNINGEVRPYVDGISLDTIINLGQKAWAIIEKNKPSVNLKLQKADALPEGVSAWSDLECWQIPQSRLFKVTYKNGFGMNVVNLAFRVSYTYGGRINGQGRYLSQVAVLPAQIDVAWGFKLDAEVRVANVTNAGTRQSPVGGIQLDVNWVVNTPFKYSESTESFYVRGDGLFKQL